MVWFVSLAFRSIRRVPLHYSCLCNLAFDTLISKHVPGVTECLGERPQHKPHQYGDDGNDAQKLDQGHAGLSAGSKYCHVFI